MTLTITPLDDAPDPYLAWDTVWNAQQGLGDWALGTPAPAPAGTFNPGGLLAANPIGTAVAIGLFTDARCPDDHPLAYLAGGDLRGWWGDGVDVRADLGEQPLGSLLWLLYNASATDDNALWARQFALDALQPLIAAGVATHIEASATADPAHNALVLDVTVTGVWNGRSFNQTFAAIWSRAQALAPPLQPAIP